MLIALTHSLFSFFIQSAFNFTTSIDQTRTNWNALRCSSFPILSTCTWMLWPPVKSRAFGVSRRWFFVHITSRCVATRDCWSLCRIGCLFLLNHRSTMRRKIFTPVTLNGGRIIAIRRCRGGQWIKCIKSRLRIGCQWWQRWCSSSTSS